MEQYVLRKGNGHWLLPLPGAALVLVVNLAVHILYVIFYSHVLDPGHDLAAYRQHAVKSSPYVTFIVGFPTTIVVAWTIARRTPRKHKYVTALSVAVFYLLLDTMILAIVDELAAFGLLFAISHAPYLVAAFIGARLAESSRSDVGAATRPGHVCSDSGDRS